MGNKKRIVYFLMAISLILLITNLISCKKYYSDEDSPYYNQGDEIDTINIDWHDQYVYGGTLNNDINDINGSDGPLVDTKWVLNRVTIGYASTYPNDTIEFTNNKYYIVNSGGIRLYTLSGLMGSTDKTLTLNYFFPFGGSNYSGEVGLYFVDDGIINNGEFIDTQNSNITIRAWFVKLN